MIREFGPEATGRQSPLRDNVQQLREKCVLLQGGVNLKGMTTIEKKYRWGAALTKTKAPRELALQRSVGCVVFDSRMDLRPPTIQEVRQQQYILLLYGCVLWAHLCFPGSQVCQTSYAGVLELVQGLHVCGHRQL